MAPNKRPLKTQKPCLLIIFHLKKFLSILAYLLNKCRNSRNNSQLSPPTRKHNTRRTVAKSSQTLVHPKTPPQARNIFALANVSGQAKRNDRQNAAL